MAKKYRYVMREYDRDGRKGYGEILEEVKPRKRALPASKVKMQINLLGE